jgi:hypothetical protein
MSGVTGPPVDVLDRKDRSRRLARRISLGSMAPISDRATLLPHPAVTLATLGEVGSDGVDMLVLSHGAQSRPVRPVTGPRQGPPLRYGRPRWRLRQCYSRVPAQRLLLAKSKSVRYRRRSRCSLSDDLLDPVLVIC